MVLVGVHHIWVNASTVEAEGYVLNTGHQSSTGPILVHGLLYSPTGSDLTLDQQVDSAKPWAPGEVRPWKARFADAPPMPYRTVVNIFADESYWTYETACLAPDGSTTEGCRPFPTPRWTTSTEPGLWPSFLECCEWVPPPVDVYAMQCEIRGQLECTAVVENWRGDALDPLAEVLVRVADEEPVMRDEVDIGGRFPGREKRDVRFSVDWLPNVVLQPNASYEVELRVGNATLPKSFANETVRVPALQSE